VAKFIGFIGEYPPGNYYYLADMEVQEAIIFSKVSGVNLAYMLKPRTTQTMREIYALTERDFGRVARKKRELQHAINKSTHL
jgi:hypothetical protein